MCSAVLMLSIPVLVISSVVFILSSVVLILPSLVLMRGGVLSLRCPVLFLCSHATWIMQYSSMESESTEIANAYMLILLIDLGFAIRLVEFGGFIA